MNLPGRKHTLILSAVCGLGLLQFTAVAALAPAISNVTIVAGHPQLTIASELSMTNQVQTATSLDQTNWQVLTNILVTQSPYTILDLLQPPAPRRFYRVLLLPPTNSAAPEGMILIPSGAFQMGDTFAEGEPYELPVHTVNVSAFYLAKYEVTKSLWDQVKNWSGTNGYAYDNPGAGKGPDHPVQTLNWYDAVKWCNARSEMERRVPAYYTDAALTQVYKTGQANPYVNWNAGYRLPAEAEWEKASRGGASGHRFPWTDSDTITHSKANYYSDSSFSYDLSPTRGFDPAFVSGDLPYTAPVGSFAPNGYGLYDMAGNVWEWCWDFAGSYPSDPQTDPRGPATGSTRVGRGGNWDFYPAHCRNAYRYGNPPDHAATNIGFRCALPAQQ